MPLRELKGVITMNDMENNIIDTLLGRQSLTNEQETYLDDHPTFKADINAMIEGLESVEHFIDVDVLPIHETLILAEKKKRKQKLIKNTLFFLGVAIALMVTIGLAILNFGWTWFIALQLFTVFLVPWYLIMAALKERGRTNV